MWKGLGLQLSILKLLCMGEVVSLEPAQKSLVFHKYHGA